jgi:hypothetical protein
MPSTATDWITAIKAKKTAIDSFLGGARYNHPQRIASITLSGTIDYEIDERDFTVNESPAGGATASVYVFALDYTAVTPYIRKFQEQDPWYVLPVALVAGEFTLSHRPRAAMWEIRSDIFDYDEDQDVVGTVTRTRYVYNDGTSSWDLDTTDAAEDITLTFAFSISGGGDPTSGGRDDDSTDENATIAVFASHSGTYGIKLADFNWGDILRFPWVDTWAPETAEFATGFSNFITDSNAADGAGHSGSCSLSVDFIY